MSAAKLSLIALSLCLSLCGACSTHHALRPDQLQALDGYSPARRVESPPGPTAAAGVPAPLLAPGTLRLKDAAGDWFELDRNTVLTLKGEAGALATGTLVTAHVDERSLQGMLGDGATIDVPLESIRSADLANHSAGRTAALGVGLGAVGMAVAAILVANAFAPHLSSAGGAGGSPCTLCWLPSGLLTEAARGDGRGPPR